jgi:PhzF family phenazine biosynthesis protein
MEMCGHATIGALWVLATKGRLPGEQVRIETRSGSVTGYVDRVDSGDPSVEISQPVGKVVDLSHAEEEDVLSTLKLSRRDLLDLPVQNAVTSRVKTLIPIKGVRELSELVPDPAQIEACCGRIGSTGLYPYAIDHQGERRFEARLAFGLLKNELVEPNSERITIMQGRAMGALSEIRVRLGFAGGRPVGCLLGGSVTRAEQHVLQP